MRQTQFAVSALLLFLLLVACTPPAAPAPAQAPAAARAPQAPLAPEASAKPAWQAEWDRTLQAAKAEGVVTIYSTAGPEPRAAVADAIKKKFGLRTEVVGGKSSELTEKALRERRAGLYLVDLYMAGNSTILPFKSVGGLEPLDAVLILPEVTDPKMWWGGRFPWITDDHVELSSFAEPEATIAINTNLVQPGEMKGYKDLLNPKWKGKTVYRDMSVPGGAAKWFASTLQMGILTEANMRQLNAQKGSLVRDSRLQTEWLAQGKYAIAVAPDGQVLEPMLKLGIPVKKVIPEEGTHLSSDSACIGLMNKAPHPNAAKLFINWFLSKEGQTVYSIAVGSTSRRLDVPTDHLDSRQLLQPGVKYFDYDYEEIILKEVELRKLAKEIFEIQ